MKTLPALLLAAALAACTTTSPDVIQRGDANRLSSVQDAVVLNVRPVTVDGTQSGVGGAAGAVVGGVAGSGASHGKTGAVVGVIGAVVAPRDRAGPGQRDIPARRSGRAGVHRCGHARDARPGGAAAVLIRRGALARPDPGFSGGRCAP